MIFEPDLNKVCPFGKHACGENRVELRFRDFITTEEDGPWDAVREISSGCEDKSSIGARHARGVVRCPSSYGRRR